MKLDDFINKYEGKFVDVDGFPSSNKYQCTDLYRTYVKEVLGYPQSPPVEGAKDIWNSYLPEYFTRIENTPDGVPQKGDIIIFGTGLGKYGHVSIFLEGNINRFTSLDQNYPTGSPVHKQGHTYNAVIGWLTPKEQKMDTPNWFNTLLQERGLSLEREGEFRAFWEKAVRYDDEIKSLQEQVKSNAEALADRAREVSMLTEKNQRLADEATEAEELLNQKRVEIAEKNSQLRTQGFELDKAVAKVKKLEEDMVAMQSDNKGLRERLVKADKQSIQGIGLLRFIQLKYFGGDK